MTDYIVRIFTSPIASLSVLDLLAVLGLVLLALVVLLLLVLLARYVIQEGEW